MQIIPFSAFWLRSSVVSVLISLISDMWTIGSHDIKLIFWGRVSITIACYWDSYAWLLFCTIARVCAAHPKQFNNLCNDIFYGNSLTFCVKMFILFGLSPLSLELLFNVYTGKDNVRYLCLREWNSNVLITILTAFFVSYVLTAGKKE